MVNALGVETNEKRICLTSIFNGRYILSVSCKLNLDRVDAYGSCPGYRFHFPASELRHFHNHINSDAHVTMVVDLVVLPFCR